MRGGYTPPTQTQGFQKFLPHTTTNHYAQLKLSSSRRVLPHGSRDLRVRRGCVRVQSNLKSSYDATYGGRRDANNGKALETSGRFEAHTCSRRALQEKQQLSQGAAAWSTWTATMSCLMVLFVSEIPFCLPRLSPLAFCSAPLPLPQAHSLIHHRHGAGSFQSCEHLIHSPFALRRRISLFTSCIIYWNRRFRAPIQTNQQDHLVWRTHH